jgi:NAD(P)-dependent dehydrogenase (short-subunit alcohol dehydrogenase family)
LTGEVEIDRKIRVNTFSPGPIDTPILSGLAPTDKELKLSLARQVPHTPS